MGYPVIGSDDDLPRLRDDFSDAVIAIGQLPDSSPRVCLVQLASLDFHFPVLISAHAVVSRYAQLGPGTTVGHGVIVNADLLLEITAL